MFAAVDLRSPAGPPAAGFNYNVEEWFEGDRYETLAICRNLAIARAAFMAAIAEKPAGKVHDPQPGTGSPRATGSVSTDLGGGWRRGPARRGGRRPLRLGLRRGCRRWDRD